MALDLNNPDLTADPDARLAVKDETVWVEFATETGDLISAVGRNRYRPGDALITGSTGDSWCVSGDRFDAKYARLPPTVCGERGRYRNRPMTVLAKRMQTAFTCVASGRRGRPARCRWRLAVAVRFGRSRHCRAHPFRTRVPLGHTRAHLIFAPGVHATSVRRTMHVRPAFDRPHLPRRSRCFMVSTTWQSGRMTQPAARFTDSWATVSFATLVEQSQYVR